MQRERKTWLKKHGRVKHKIAQKGSGAQKGYKTEKMHARHALVKVNKTLIKESREYGGLIYKIGKRYFYSPAVKGDENSLSPYKSKVPKGAKVTAYYHTHGGVSSNRSADENFSDIPVKRMTLSLDIGFNEDGSIGSATTSRGEDLTLESIGDIPFAKNHNINGYLATPGNSFKHYNVSEDREYDYGNLE